MDSQNRPLSELSLEELGALVATEASEGAFHELFEVRLKAWAKSKAERSVAPRDGLAQDALSSAMERLWFRASSYDSSQAAYKAWASVIIVREARRVLAKEKNRERLLGL